VLGDRGLGKSAMTAACMLAFLCYSFVPMSLLLPPPRVPAGQGNWKIGSLWQFAISVACPVSPPTRLPPFTSTLAQVKRRSPVLALSWPQDKRDVVRPTLSCLCAHRQRPRAVVGVGLLLASWMFGSKPARPVLLHVLVPNERRRERAGRSPAREIDIWHSALM